jgi:hypothetical protein
MPMSGGSLDVNCDGVDSFHGTREDDALSSGGHRYFWCLSRDAWPLGAALALVSAMENLSARTSRTPPMPVTGSPRRWSPDVTRRIAKSPWLIEAHLPSGRWRYQILPLLTAAARSSKLC